MTFKERNEIFNKLEKKYPNLSWQPMLIPVMRVGFKFYLRFDVKVNFEEMIPNDGVVIFPQNHCNFYDSMVAEKALRGNYYTCFASDEPRGTFQGSGFEALSVVWVNRDDKESRTMASECLLELLKNDCNLSWCPEGLWDLSDNKLLLHISRGLAKVAIEGSKYNKVYVMPMVTNYVYKDNSTKIERAEVDLCKAIRVNSNMDVIELTELIEDTMWTKRWEQLERNANNSKNSRHYECLYGSEYVFDRNKLSKQDWNNFIYKLKSQFALDWEKEMNYEIKSKVQKEQEEVERTLSLIELKHFSEMLQKEKMKEEISREQKIRVRKK